MTSPAELRDRLADSPASLGPEPLLARGFVSVRLYELTGDAGWLDSARAAFGRALVEASGSAWAQYGLALALAGGASVHPPPPRGLAAWQGLQRGLERGPLDRARAAALRVLDLDPGFDRARLLVARIAVHEREPERLREAIALLRSAPGTGVPDTGPSHELLVAAAELELALDEPAAAASTARAALARRPGDAVAHLVLAEALLRQPGLEEEGARAYFETDSLDDRAAARYFRDIEPLASAGERASWPADPRSRARWLRRFWEVRAALAGMTVAERLAVHYRRLAEARARYPRRGRSGAPPRGAALARDPGGEELDARGAVLLRYGAPDRVVRTVAGGGAEVQPYPDNETWVYFREGGKALLFHFYRAPLAGPDYALLGELPSCDPTFPSPLPYSEQYYTDRIAYAPEYQSLVAECRQLGATGDRTRGAALTAVRLSAELRAAVLGALEREDARPRFARALPLLAALYRLRGERGATRVVAALAVPVAGPGADPAGKGRRIALRASLIVIDTVTGRVTRRDSLVELRAPERLAPGHALRFYLELDATPSRTAIYRLVLRDATDPDAGALRGGPLDLPDYGAGSPMLSDLMLAELDARGGWPRDSFGLALLPGPTLPSRTFGLFYEIYGLAPGTPYRTEITIERAVAGARGWLRRILGGRHRLRLAFDGIARPGPDGAVRESRRLDLRLPASAYTLRVRVRDGRSGGTAERSARLRLPGS